MKKQTEPLDTWKIVSSLNGVVLEEHKTIQQAQAKLDVLRKTDDTIFAVPEGYVWSNARKAWTDTLTAMIADMEDPDLSDYVDTLPKLD